MEKEILQQLKSLEREGRNRLAEIRRLKKESRPSRRHSQTMEEFLRARKSGVVDESYLLNKFLDKDDLPVADRHALTRRRRLLGRKNTPAS
jgi:hypothetical protein